MLFEYLKVNDSISIKKLEKEHAHELFQIVDKNREYLRNWLGWIDQTKEVKNSLQFIEQTKNLNAQDKAFSAGIWHQDKLVGTIGVSEINKETKTAFIGYWIISQEQGKGVVTKSVHAIINYLFKKGINTVRIRCAPKNARSQKIPLRLGFEKKFLIKDGENLYGKLNDLIVFELENPRKIKSVSETTSKVDSTKNRD